MLKNKITSENMDKFVFYFSIIDIMFLPYIFFISTNYSLIFLAIWFLFRIKEIIKMKEFRISCIMTFFIILSTVISFLYYPKILSSGHEIWIQNIKMAIQYISYFAYYIMFVFCIKKYNFNIKKFLIYFITFVTSLAIIYVIDKNWFASLKMFWNNVDSYTIWFKEDVMMQYRYNFIWTDPNNPAYAFVSIAAYLIFNNKTNIFEKIFICCSTIFMLTCSMSTGGFLSLGILLFIAVICILIPKLIKREYHIKITKKIVIIAIITITLIVLITPLISNTPIFKEAMDRVVSNRDEGANSRFEIWIKVLKKNNIFKNVLYGTGGRQVIIDNNTIISPHNGHLYLIYSYGMIFYGIFIWEFFRKRREISIKHYLFIIPVFIGFTINTIVGEQKFIILYLLLYVSTYLKDNKIEKSEKFEETIS